MNSHPLDDPDSIFAEGGAHEAVLDSQAMKARPMIRYIGFSTATKIHHHLYMLKSLK